MLSKISAAIHGDKYLITSSRKGNAVDLPGGGRGMVYEDNSYVLIDDGQNRSKPRSRDQMQAELDALNTSTVPGSDVLYRNLAADISLYDALTAASYAWCGGLLIVVGLLIGVSI